MLVANATPRLTVLVALCQRWGTMLIPTAPERRRIAGTSLVSERQVYKAYTAPERCQPVTVERVRRAAAELGLPVPPATTTTTGGERR